MTWQGKEGGGGGQVFTLQAWSFFRMPTLLRHCEQNVAIWDLVCLKSSKLSHQTCGLISIVGLPITQVGQWLQLNLRLICPGCFAMTVSTDH